jgi:hypothetical protein
MLVACPVEAETRRAHRSQQTRIINLLRRLVGLGIREIAADPLWLGQEDFRALYRHADPPLVLHTTPDEPACPPQTGLLVPRLSLLHGDCSPQQLATAMEVERPVHIVLLPEQLADPQHSARQFLDTRSSLPLDELIRRLDRWES